MQSLRVKAGCTQGTKTLPRCWERTHVRDQARIPKVTKLIALVLQYVPSRSGQGLRIRKGLQSGIQRALYGKDLSEVLTIGTQINTTNKTFLMRNPCRYGIARVYISYSISMNILLNSNCNFTQFQFQNYSILPNPPNVNGECCTQDETQGLRVRARCLRPPRPYQGAESVLTYVTEPESRKQRLRSPSCNSIE